MFFYYGYVVAFFCVLEAVFTLAILLTTLAILISKILALPIYANGIMGISENIKKILGQWGTQPTPN